MRSLDSIEEYVGLLCQQIRWKKARYRVSEEIRNHITDGRDAYISQGFDKNSATERAIADTGDATAIGSQLDRIHRPKAQWSMFTATAALLLLGLLVSLLVVNDGNGIQLQSLYLTGIGVAGMLVAYFLDFTLFGKYPTIIYLGVVSISIVMLLLSPTTNGRSYYTQYITLLFPLAFSAIVFATRNRGYLGIILCGLALLLLGVIALYIPSVSGFSYFLIIGTAILGIAINRGWFGVKKIYGFLLMLAPVALLIIIFAISMTSHMWTRLAVAFNPSIDPNGTGYMGIMTRDLLSGASLFGGGMRNIQGEDLLLTLGDDLLLTVSISRLGWIAFAVIIAALLFFTFKGFIYCFKQKSCLGFIISFTIMMTLTIQIISYITYNLGFQFASPISLPLISHGNTAMIINLVLIGFMLSVFRTGDVVVDGNAPATIKQDKNKRGSAN